MDKKYIEENEIEIKYLRNQLTSEELEGFEVYLMENPEFLETLELDKQIASALNSAAIIQPKLSLVSFLPKIRYLAAGLVSFGALASLFLFLSPSFERETSIISYELEALRSSSADLSNANLVVLSDDEQKVMVELVYYLVDDGLETHTVILETYTPNIESCKTDVMSNRVLGKSKSDIDGRNRVIVQAKTLVKGQFILCAKDDSGKLLGKFPVRISRN